MTDTLPITLKAGYGLASLFLAACVATALLQQEHRSVFFLLVLAGAAFGWLLGLFFATSAGESMATKFLQILTAALSGFSLAKAQEIASSDLVRVVLPRPESLLVGGALFVISLVVGFLATWVWSQHRSAIENEAERRKNIEKIHDLLARLA